MQPNELFGVMNHFVTILCGCDPKFPLHLWDRLVPQSILTLNLLRASRINPKLSAHAQLHGAFDFNRTPIGPLGTKVVAHEKPSVRESWAPHGAPAWYISPATEHYRCYKVYVIETGAERITDTLEWFPAHVPMPKTASIDAVLAAARELIDALRNPAPATPFAGIDDTKLAALHKLATIFQPPANDVPPTETAPTEPIPAPPPRVEGGKSIPPMTYAEATMNPGQRRRQQQAKERNVPPIVEPLNKLPADPITTQMPEQPTRRSDRIKQRSETATVNAAIKHVQTIPALNAVLDPITGESLTYRQLIRGPDKAIWLQGCANEIGRLAQGLDNSDITGTETIHFIPHTALPEGRRATYVNIVVDIRPQKSEPHRVRMTVGGNLIDYPYEVSTPTADMTTAKLVMNSTISTPGATFHCFDISNFYLNTPMERYEYMRIPLWAIPECIMEQYKLADLAHNGSVLVEIRKGMYGLPQAGKIAYDRLVQHLNKFGYGPTRHTDGLWRHKTRPILFSLIVDDFGVKTVGREHAEHLLAAIKVQYKCTADWAGTLYSGITLKWDYKNRIVDLSMPGYIQAALHRFQHPKLAKPEHSPHAWMQPVYGTTIQLAPLEDNSPRLNAEGVTRVQQIIGTLLHYARAVDSTMLVALSSLAAEQTKSTVNTAKALTRLLNYAATHPDAILRFTASDMIYHISSDASYLSEPKAKSRVGGHHYLSNKSIDPMKPPHVQPPNNGAIHTTCNILKNVMASAAEAETAALFHNTQHGAMIRTILEEMGHPQPPTPVQTDNSTAVGLANGTIRQRKSKAMDMRFYWVQDRVKQGQFLVYWNKGSTNRGDYFTKHHPTSHHVKMRPTYLHVAANASTTGTARVCSSRSREIRDPVPAGDTWHALLGRRLARHVAKHYARQRYATQHTS